MAENESENKDMHAFRSVEVPEHMRLVAVDADGVITELADIMSDERVSEMQEYIRSKTPESQKFIVVYQKKDGELARDLSPRAYRMLGYLRSIAGYNNVINGFTHKKAMNFLNIKDEKTSFAAIKELVKTGVVTRKRKSEAIGSYIYSISPSICWKGSLYRKNSQG